MINTYQTGVPAPALPPRHGGSGPVLVPVPVQASSSSGQSKTLLWFLVCVVLLHVLLSVGGFGWMYLYRTGRLAPAPPDPPAEAQAARLSAGRAPRRPLAHMKVKEPAGKASAAPGYLQWNIGQSVRRNIDYHRASWLTVTQAGDYYVYAQVTFSRRNGTVPLVSVVRVWQSEAGEVTATMKAYCSLQDTACTAAQGQVISLQAGNQLAVWVQDLSCVDYDGDATGMGMYRL